MAGGIEPYDDPSIKGLGRYFNSKTIKGRANVAKATFAFLLLGALYYKVGGKKKQSCNCPE